MTAEDADLHDITRQDGRFTVLDRFLRGTVDRFNRETHRHIPPADQRELVLAGLRRVRDAKQGVVRDLAYDLLSSTHDGDLLRDCFYSYLEHYVGQEVERIAQEAASDVADPEEETPPTLWTEDMKEDLAEVERTIAEEARKAVRQFALERLARDLPGFIDPSEQEADSPSWRLKDQYNRIIEIVQERMPPDEAFDPMSLAAHVRQLLQGREEGIRQLVDAGDPDKLWDPSAFHLIEEALERGAIEPIMAEEIAAVADGYDCLQEKLEEEGYDPPYPYYDEPWMQHIFGDSDPENDHLPDGYEEQLQRVGDRPPVDGDSDPEYSQDNPQSDQEDDVSDGDVDAHVAFEKQQKAHLEHTLRRTLAQLECEVDARGPTPKSSGGITAHSAEKLASDILDHPNIGPDFAWGLVGRLYSGQPIMDQFYAHLERVAEDTQRMMEGAHGEEGADLARMEAEMALRKFIVEHDLNRGGEGPDRMCAEKHPDEPHVVCGMMEGHDGEHHSGSYTWPRDAESYEACGAEHPEADVECDITAGHDGKHHAHTDGVLSYSWAQEEDEEGPVCGHSHPDNDHDLITCERPEGHGGLHMMGGYEWTMADDEGPSPSEFLVDAASEVLEREMPAYPDEEIRDLAYSIARTAVDAEAYPDVPVAERTDMESPRHGREEKPLCDSNHHNDDPPEAVVTTIYGNLLCEECYEIRQDFMAPHEFRVLETPSQTSTEVEEGEPLRRFAVIPRDGTQLEQRTDGVLHINAAAVFMEDGMIQFLGPKGEVWTSLNKDMVEYLDREDD